VIVVDVNLLLYAVIDGFPEHPRAREWWEATLNSTTEVGLSGPAVFGFLRISTNPRVLASPLPIGDATGQVTDWLTQPNVQYLHPGPRHLEIAFKLLHDVGTAGNLTTDAQLAAFAIELDADLCSNDADFGRFRGLRWINPLV
jgi:toxin-antitoxin system PIN domain toxin